MNLRALLLENAKLATNERNSMIPTALFEHH